jgi:hypothetical protein
MNEHTDGMCYCQEGVTCPTCEREKKAVPINGKAIERAVMEDKERPCLYRVMGPCQHPDCLEAHYKTLYEAAANAR